jgi:hypothetical protein
MQGNTVEKSDLKSKSAKQLTTPLNQEISNNLPLHVSMQLYDLMKMVVKDEVTPETVNSACNCAAQICKVLDLELRAERLLK